jgi:quinol monooxygenase YgiN
VAETVVVAMFKAKPGQEQALIEGLRPTIEQSHQEEGCLAYALHRDTMDSSRFALVERWRSREDLEEHLQKPYVAALAGVAGEILAEPAQVSFTDPIPVGDAAKGALSTA